MYPWGALVFVKPPAQLEKGGKKFEPKTTPHIIVSLGQGPGMTWNKTYGVVKLAKMLGANRGSRACIRYTTDIMFPDVPTFPSRLKLTAAGALGDANLPAPAVPDVSEEWKLIEDEGESSDDASELPNQCQALLQSTFFEAIVLDPEDASSPEEAEIASIEASADIPPLQDDEVQPQGIRAPRAWRIDVFDQRQVSVPPWSRRPPAVFPEAWILYSKREQEAQRALWLASDPAGHRLQEAGRNSFLADKAACRRGGLNVQALRVVGPGDTAAAPELLLFDAKCNSASGGVPSERKNPGESILPCCTNVCSRPQRKVQAGSNEGLGGRQRRSCYQENTRTYLSSCVAILTARCAKMLLARRLQSELRKTATYSTRRRERIFIQ